MSHAYFRQRGLSYRGQTLCPGVDLKQPEPASGEDTDSQGGRKGCHLPVPRSLPACLGLSVGLSHAMFPAVTFILPISQMRLSSVFKGLHPMELHSLARDRGVQAPQQDAPHPILPKAHPRAKAPAWLPGLSLAWWSPPAPSGRRLKAHGRTVCSGRAGKSVRLAQLPGSACSVPASCPFLLVRPGPVCCCLAPSRLGAVGWAPWVQQVSRESTG